MCEFLYIYGILYIHVFIYTHRDAVKEEEDVIVVCICIKYIFV